MFILILGPVIVSKQKPTTDFRPWVLVEISFLGATRCHGVVGYDDHQHQNLSANHIHWPHPKHAWNWGQAPNQQLSV
jgi:hypothetical protein